MERVLDIVKENSPEQTTIVFSGSGLVDGEETKGLDQAVYADDMQGVDALTTSTKNLKGEFIIYEPESETDRVAYKKLLSIPGEAEKLERFVTEINRNTKEPVFFTVYSGVELLVRFIKFE